MTLPDMQSENEQLNACLKLIEAKLNWGPCDKWATKDFQTLGDKIFQETNVALSVATLKRVWGIVTYQNRPTITTLDTLARFIGFANWRAFQQSLPIAHPGKKSIALPIKRSYKRAGLVIILASLAILLGWVQFKNSVPSLPTLKKQEFKFNSKKMVTEGVPNSVIFDFDASAADVHDSIFIQQSWDKRLRKQVARTEKNHSSIYYHPGFFRAKLVVRDSIMGGHDIFIRTNGWLPLVENGQEIPVYFSEKDAIRKNGQMYLSEEQIKTRNINMQPRVPWVNYYFMNDMPGADFRNFIFETRLKNTYKEGAGICQNTLIEIRFAGGAFVIPLSVKGCVSDLQFMDADGPVRDVSKLGVDFSDWVTVNLQVKEGKGQLYINDSLAYQLNFDIEPLALKGIRFLFEGGGVIDEIAFKKPTGQVIFQESF